MYNADDPNDPEPPIYTQTQSYDALNRRIEVVLPHQNEDAVLSDHYDLSGRLIEQVDGRSHATQYRYEPELGRLETLIDAEQGRTSFEYDALNRVEAITAPNGARTAYKIDPLGRVVEEDSPDRGVQSYEYDAVDHLETFTDARGMVSNYGYDALHRLTTMDYPGTEEDVAFTYDSDDDGCTYGLGRLCRVNDHSGQYDYDYDGYGNVKMLSYRPYDGDPMTPFVTQYTYDAGDRLDGMTLPSGRVVTHTRDTLRRLEQITTTVGGSTINVIDALKYQADGALTEQTFGNGLVLVRDYDQQGRLTHETLTASVLVASEDFEYDHNSNLKQRITPTATYDYDYDALDRLTNQTGSGDQLDYQYDANGNRTSRDVNGQVTTLTTLTESNRLDTINSVSVDLNPAGALDSFEQRTFEYNAAGRLSKVRENGQLVATYRYNQAGLRTHKTVGSVTTLYHYDLAGRLISETEPDGTVIREYIYALGVPVAQIDGGAPERIRYVHTDHLGTPWLATDDQAGIIWRWQGRAFGDHAPDVYPDGDGSLTEINLRFPGQYADAETGFYYNWNRYYDPSTGRYLTSDPIGLAGGLNTYGYANNNPLLWIDILGLAEIIFWHGVGVGSSSFGHISGNVNGRNYSFGPGGWDTKYPNPADYAARNTKFRSGSGVILNLTPPEEDTLESCLQEADDSYHFYSNNCVGPFASCLRSIDIDGGNPLLPRDFYQNLLRSDRSDGPTFYQGPDRSIMDDLDANQAP